MKKTLILTASMLSMVAVLCFAATGLAVAGHCPKADKPACNHADKAKPAADDHCAKAPDTQIDAGTKNLADALSAIELAKKAIQDGDTPLTLAQLEKAQALISHVVKNADKHAVAFTNTVCPIMGSKINAAKVPDSLVREYKGQKVAFCCGGCPDQWDKLTDAERDAKLKTN